MWLPTELVLRIIHEVIDTPAVFIFNVELGEVPHPPVFPQSGQIRFRPLLSPPTDHQGHDYPGSYESQVSKTIRSLLLTSKWIRAECLKRLQGITVPTISRHAIVRFNPQKHIICLYSVDSLRHQFVPNPRPTPGRWEFEHWIRHDSDLWTNLDFDLKHLAFMGEGRGTQKRCLAFFRTVFPNLRHVYSAVIEIPRKNPTQPIGLICPDQQPAHELSPMFLYMAKQSSNHTKTMLSFEAWQSRGGGYSGDDWVYDFEFGALVLI